MKEVATGLQALYSLGLEGSPGADVIPATIRVWAFDLWQSRKRYWVEDGDVTCIRQAFSNLRSSCNRWPTQPKFWEALPERKSKGPALFGPDFGREREKEALAAKKLWLRDLGYNEWGERIA